jgi:GntR family transcriptional regulator
MTRRRHDKGVTAIEALLRRDVPIPFYYQLMQLLESEIRAGAWSAHALIPSEYDLCAQYGVSRTVVRQALGELVAKGLLYRVKGKGTFVAPRKLQEKFIQRAEGFYDEMTQQGLTVRSSVLEQHVQPPPPHVQEQLALPDGSLTIKIGRLRFIEEQPLQVVTTYIPQLLCPGLELVDLTRASLYAVLRQRYGLAVASGTRTLEAIEAQQPITKLLAVPKGKALFKMTSISYLVDGRPFEYYEAWHRGDRSKFEIELAVVSNAASPPRRQGGARVTTAPIRQNELVG